MSTGPNAHEATQERVRFFGSNHHYDVQRFDQSEQISTLSQICHRQAASQENKPGPIKSQLIQANVQPQLCF